jgi:5-methylcytosine-specific restriction endonuclease McrA
MELKDSKRGFDESQRIAIYRRDRGLCQQCLKEGMNEKEATVSWGEWDADHIKPWIAGGKTNIEQAQVLCRVHNEKKGASSPKG